MLRYEQDAEIVVQKRVLENAERERDEHELTRGGGPRERHPFRPPGGGARERQRGLHEREAERQDQCELADFRDHRFTVPRVFARASATSGGV